MLKGEGEEGRLPVLQLHMPAPDPGPRHERIELLHGPASCLLAIQPPWRKAGGVDAGRAVRNLRAEAGRQLVEAFSAQDGPAAGRQLEPAQAVKVPAVQAVHLLPGQQDVFVTGGATAAGGGGVRNDVPARRHERRRAGTAHQQADVPVDGGAGVEVDVVGPCVQHGAVLTYKHEER